MMLVRYAVMIFLCHLSIVGVCLGQTSDPIQEAAHKLADSIEKAGFTRVAVFPVLFNEDLRQENAEDSTRSSSINVIDALLGAQSPKPKLVATSHAKLFADQMLAGLAAVNNERFRIVAGESVLQTLRDAQVNLSRLHPHSNELRKLASADPTIEGLVVGVIRERLDPPRASAGESDDRWLVKSYAWQDVSWELIDLSDGTIRSAASDSHFTSLADAVYRGRSQEFFRWEGGRLRILFNERFPLPPTSTVPLRPSDSIDLYKIDEDWQEVPHPVFNPNCPFKISYAVNNIDKPLSVPIVSQKSEFPGRDNGFNHEIAAGLAFLAIEPGDDLRITVSNKSAKRVMVAVLVDGINTLGKKLELPDERCSTWSLAARDQGVFKGWYSGAKGEEQLEEFETTSWEDSIAAKLGVVDQAKAITVVVFTEGWPKRTQLVFFERHWSQESWWDARSQQLRVTEEMSPPGSAGARAEAAGMRGKKPVPGNLNWGAAEPTGAILASMTVWYAPSSQLPKLAKEKIAQFKYNFWDQPTDTIVWKLVSTLPSK